MKRSLFATPDAYSVMPLLALVPSFGKPSKLEALVSSLHARLETVQELRSAESQRGQAKRYLVEEDMLREVLDWLSIRSEGEGG
jgi:hypothetical protein